MKSPTAPRMRAWRWCGLIVLAGWPNLACERAPEQPVAPKTAPEGLRFQPVLDTRLAQVCPPEPEAPVIEIEEEDYVLGLLHTLAHSEARFQKVAREELAQLGSKAGLDLLLLESPDRLTLEQQVEAVRALAWDELRDVETLVAVATSGRLAVSPYTHRVRREALYQLGLLQDDRALLRLIRHLKYEKDPENFLWLGWALLQLDNGAGLPALYDLTRSQDPDLAQRAHQTLQEAAAQRDTTPEELLPSWLAGDLAIWPRPAISDALRCQVWTEISHVAGKHFQMRGIDDARTQLSGMPPWVAEPLAEVLQDQDGYVRLHAAQILQRMGPRARSAVPALAAILEDPTAGAIAAEALGAIGTTEAFEALSQAAQSTSSRALRIAALRAFALADNPRGAQSARETFLAAQRSGDTELADAAACAGLRTQPDAAFLEYLIAQLERPDSALITRTLDAWIQSPSRALAPELRAAHRELRATPPGIPSLQQTLAHNRAYGQWLATHKEQLLPAAPSAE